jgi:hypothetical protein
MVRTHHDGKEELSLPIPENSVSFLGCKYKRLYTNIQSNNRAIEATTRSGKTVWRKRLFFQKWLKKVAFIHIPAYTCKARMCIALVSMRSEIAPDTECARAKAREKAQLPSIRRKAFTRG